MKETSHHDQSGAGKRGKAHGRKGHICARAVQLASGGQSGAKGEGQYIARAGSWVKRPV